MPFFDTPTDIEDAPPIADTVAPSATNRILDTYVRDIGWDPTNPHDFTRLLDAPDRMLALYRIARRDEQVGACWDQRLEAAASLPWRVEPATEDRADGDAADELRRQLERFDFQRSARQMVHAVWNGYSLAECLWRPGAGRVELADIKVRAPDRFAWTANGWPALRHAGALGGPVPPRKFWVARMPGEHADFPYGVGLGRRCYWLATLRRIALRMWGVGVERFASPIARASYPAGATKEQKAALAGVVQRIQQGASVTHPRDQELELLETRARVGPSFDDFARYLDASIAKVVLGQSATAEQGPWRGTAEVQMKVRDEVIGADIRLLDRTFAEVVGWWTGWNFPGARPPMVTRRPKDEADLEAEGKRLYPLIAAGYRPTIEHVRETFGGEWEAMPTQMPGGAPGPGAQFAAPDAPDAIRAAVDRVLEDGWRPMMSGTVQPLLDAAREADERGESLAEFRQRLPRLAADLDDAELAETLARMGFSAHAAGMLDDDAAAG